MRISNGPVKANTRRVGATVALGLTLAVLLAGTARAEACASFDIEQIDGTSHIVGRDDVGGIQVSLEGHYLWVIVGAPADSLYPERDVQASHDVAEDVTGATVCPDGSVSFVTAPVEAVVLDQQPPSPDPMTVETVIDVAPAFDFAAFAELLAGQAGVWR